MYTVCTCLFLAYLSNLTAAKNISSNGKELAKMWIEVATAYLTILSRNWPAMAEGNN
jgi:hypothetical protein